MVSGAKIIRYCKEKFGEEWKDHYEDVLAGIQLVQRVQIRQDKECNSDKAIKIYDELTRENKTC